MFGLIIHCPDLIGEGARINISSDTIIGIDSGGSPWGQFARITFLSNGKLDYAAGPDGGFPGGVPPTDPPNSWVVGYPDAAYAADYEIRATETGTSGFGTRTGVLNTWLPLTSSHSWEVARTAAGDGGWTILIEIRHAVSQNVVASATFNLQAIDGFS